MMAAFALTVLAMVDKCLLMRVLLPQQQKEYCGLVLVKTWTGLAGRNLFFDKKTSASTFPCDRKHRLFTTNPDTENTRSACTAVPGTDNISQEVGVAELFKMCAGL